MDGICIVEKWIAWFAVKRHYMEVLHALNTRTNGPVLSDMDIPDSALAACVLHQVVVSDDVDNFQLGINITESLYKAVSHRISSRIMIRITSGMKCKILLRMMKQKRPNIVEQIKQFFPGPGYNRDSKSQMTLEEKEIAAYYEHFRSFFMTVHANKEYQRMYMQTHYRREFGLKFDLKQQELVGRLLSAINEEFHTSPVQKILEEGPTSDFVGQLRSFNLAAVELLLDTVADVSDLSENECQVLLKGLRPPFGSGIRHREGRVVASTSTGLSGEDTDWFESQHRRDIPSPSVTQTCDPNTRIQPTNKRKWSDSDGEQDIFIVSSNDEDGSPAQVLHLFSPKRARLDPVIASTSGRFNAQLSTSTGFVPDEMLCTSPSARSQEENARLLPHCRDTGPKRVSFEDLTRQEERIRPSSPLSGGGSTSSELELCDSEDFELDGDTTGAGNHGNMDKGWSAGDVAECEPLWTRGFPYEGDWTTDGCLRTGSEAASLSQGSSTLSPTPEQVDLVSSSNPDSDSLLLVPDSSDDTCRLTGVLTNSEVQQHNTDSHRAVKRLGEPDVSNHSVSSSGKVMSPQRTNVRASSVHSVSSPSEETPSMSMVSHDRRTELKVSKKKKSLESSFGRGD